MSGGRNGRVFPAFARMLHDRFDPENTKAKQEAQSHHSNTIAGHIAKTGSQRETTATSHITLDDVVIQPKKKTDEAVDSILTA
jgi:hypothetical protein